MRALFFLGEFLLHILCWLLFLIRGVSLTHPVLFSFLSAESLFNIPCCFIFIWGVSLTHPMLTLVLSGEFLLHIPCLLHFYLGSFSYTSRAGFNFISWLSLTHLMLVSFLPWEFLLHIPSWLLSSFLILILILIFIWGVSLTDPEEVSLTHAVLT